MTGCKNKEILVSFAVEVSREKLEGELKGRKKGKICQIRFYAEKILLLPPPITYSRRTENYIILISKQRAFNFY